ncbi:corticotropin-releasing factor receptor 2-like [Limulus polyphemus]|uniref:Corticotropin-releasing factor receptor 2-like n=1 Tax=Limulus polyphemus TaxID=6850 RepID=A0ABM1SFP7_LIMPO|nr:corticotropin-releasing factor receptor 2-like [Limulus polyphemus]
MTSSNSTQDKDKLRPLTEDECHLRYNTEQEAPDLYCGATWDGFYCWPPTPPGQIVSKTCDSIFASYQLLVFSDSDDQEHAYRICRDDGTWLWGNWTNYTECLGLLSSMTPPYEQMAAVWNNNNKKVCIYVRAPTTFIISWSVVMSRDLNTVCWEGYGSSMFVWILTGPMLLVLLINTIFLVNIIRILVTKLRASVSVETAQVRKSIKATVLLFPLLGITHLLFCINPRGRLERAYMITNAVMQSSQGLFLAVLYCFTNSEVQTALRNAYQRAVLRRNPTGKSTRHGGPSGTLGCSSETRKDGTKPAAVVAFLKDHNQQDVL